MSPRLPAVGSRRPTILITLAASLLLSGAAAAGPTIGFVADWPGTALGGWGGGSLLVSTTPTAHLGAFNAGPDYAGDWLAAGITRVRFSLRDVGLPQALEIHFGIGSDTNFWQYNTGFVPIAAAWTDFEVNLD